jgi:hypothetical protein
MHERAFLLSVGLVALGGRAPCGALTTDSVSLGVESEGTMAVVQATVGPGALESVAAVEVLVDGTRDSHALAFPGRPIEALVGPLGPGRHTIALHPSTLWPWPGALHLENVRARPLKPGTPEYDGLRWAPRLGLRVDTVGARSDLPLILYLERPEGDASRLRYSLVFSNEDGGTPVRALMARWGRTTDIEWACEVALSPDSKPREWSFQGPDHDTRRVATPPIAPALVVATLNNVFLARGASAASVRMVPRPVDLREATRESVMDLEPWTYGVMARELVEEGKLDAGDGEDLFTVADPRSYLYAEARLTLHHAIAAAWVEPDSGPLRSSHHGHPALALARDGWVRTAIEVGARQPRRLAWECLPATDATNGSGGCEIHATRLFGLDQAFGLGANRIAPASLKLRIGEIAFVPVL